jgi:CheY-like chemotaxis protein
VSSLNGKHILVVDDADDARLLARKILEVDGATVSAVASVDEALTLLETKLPHLIFLDLEMPQKNGMDFLATRMGDPRLRAIPTVVLSGKKDRSSVLNALLMGANDYLVKPFRATLVVQKARKALSLSSFHSKKLAEGIGSEATLSLAGELTGLNEAGCQLDCSVRFGPEEDIKIASELFVELGLENTRMRTVRSAGKYAGNARYNTAVNFVGVDHEVVVKIREKLRERR